MGTANFISINASNVCVTDPYPQDQAISGAVFFWKHVNVCLVAQLQSEVNLLLCRRDGDYIFVWLELQVVGGPHNRPGGSGSRSMRACHLPVPAAPAAGEVCVIQHER